METVVRVLVLYLFIIVGLRIMGKREFSEMSPLELVTLLLIPDILSQALVREDFSMTNGIIAIATLFTLTFLTSLLMHRSKRAESLVSGKPIVLIENGRLLDEPMNKERVSVEEIFSQMHQSGLYKLEQVRWAILETDGRIALIPAEDTGTSSAASKNHPSGH
jgi:uncharacterized membrane protein YcaP (DUF421 family)